ncbi:MAG: Glutamate-ammonia-ligase adenylyltransferase [candidate division BRC1 bacterium ADurb.BinA364]|nr:MAG: Glutamate-ammonia-ligase adenylyltransferase [candidate division BRC1 bacterium ADurb.BinA364]
MAARALARIERTAGLEGAQAALCRFKDLEFLAAGVRELDGLADSEATARTLSAVADACCEAALRAAGAEAARGEGLDSPPEGGLAILAMGKLAAQELNLFSDLDILFIHGAAPPGVADPGQFFARWAQGAMRVLSEVSPAGFLFRVDARLRPEGRNAPLVASLERYLDYYARRAEIWEFQSLARSRAAAGDRDLVEALRIGVREPMARVGRDPGLAAAVRTMRERLAESIRLPNWARLEFKRAPGGVVDLEFIAQFLQLKHFADCEELFEPDFARAIAILHRIGALGADQTERIAANYRFLRLVESRSRMMFSTSNNFLPEKPDRLAPLEFSLAEALAGKSLTRATMEIMKSNRDLFEQIVR